MKRSMKNVIMGVMLVILTLLIIVTVYKSKCERVVENSGQPGGPMGEMSGGEVPPAGTVFEDGSVMGEDGLLYDANGNPMIMPDAAPGGMAPPGAAPSTIIVEEFDNIYYVYFGIETFVFAFILVYLFLSKFNKKEFDETFDDKLKFILCAVATIFVTAILTYVCKFTSDVLCSNVDTNGGMEPMNGMTNNMSGNQMTDQNTTPEINGTGTTPENVIPDVQNPGTMPEANTPPQGDIPENNAGSGQGAMSEGNIPPEGTMPPNMP